MRKILFILFFIPLMSVGQSRYFVYLKDKSGTAFSINTPTAFLSERSIVRRSSQNIPITEKDLPVSKFYLDEFKKLGFNIVGTSKWLNAVLVDGPSSKFTALSSLSFVKSIQDNGDIRGSTSPNARIMAKTLSSASPIDYGSSINQIRMLGADTMHKNGYTGKGVLVGVIDAGFPNVNTAQAFAKMRNEGRIVRTFNFTNNTTNVYRDNSHGTSVLSIIAGYLPGMLIGTSPDASVALYTTEVSETESKIEEVYWVFAAEDADSTGVDIINTSLGYSTFDDPNQSYSYEQLDGKTTIITKGADYATKVGIIVVNSAGNEGNKAWKYISAPSDGENVLSIGAVTSSKTKASFSSFGPSADGRVKPDVCAMGQATILSNAGSTASSGNGTSFSGPLIAGFAASLKQQFPTLTSLQLRDIIIRSADRYTSPNDEYGYGIPSYSKAVEIAQKDFLPLGNEVKCLTVNVFPNPVFKNQELTVKVGEIVLSSEHIVSLYQSDGKTIKKETKIKDLAQMQIAPGVYILNFDFSGENYSQKLFISN